MAIRIDEISKNQSNRKINKQDWDKLTVPSIFSKTSEFKSLMDKAQETYFRSLEGCVSEIDLLIRVNTMLAERILEMRGLQRVDGRFFSQALLDEEINAAIAGAWKFVPAEERPVSINDDPKGNTQLKIEQHAQEVEAGKAAEQAKPRKGRGKYKDDGSTAEPASEVTTTKMEEAIDCKPDGSSEPNQISPADSTSSDTATTLEEPTTDAPILDKPDTGTSEDGSNGDAQPIEEPESGADEVRDRSGESESGSDGCSDSDEKQDKKPASKKGKSVKSPRPPLTTKKKSGRK